MKGSANRKNEKLVINRKQHLILLEVIGNITSFGIQASSYFVFIVGTKNCVDQRVGLKLALLDEWVSYNSMRY